MTKIIQISVAVESGDIHLVALCDDGTLWLGDNLAAYPSARTSMSWTRLPLPAQLPRQDRR